jgi:hypothetical protein
LPGGYREALGQLLQPAKSWHPQLEVWGTDEGDRIDVLSSEDGPVEILARFDLRTWDPDLYKRFLAFVSTSGGRLHSADTRAELTPLN